MMARGTNADFGPNPYAFFGTAAGPDISDLAGPPGDILDTYVDGTPMEYASSALSNRSGGGPVHTSFLHRGDLHALILTVIGAWMIHRYTRA